MTSSSSESKSLFFVDKSKGASNGYNDIAATTTTVYKLYKDYLQNPKRDIICHGGNYAMESSLTFLTYKGSVPYPKQKK
ncbi:hypothetical protein L3X38_027000 [Prunus dulcis]|uniref:Uncharacterized protein n=1 Tax=Prunus dulcis TaxID=3755 RepID=A0AAD4VNJ8_PRUDU|nr:hypothetical protein L3X38_027000 [Prunus dulcis]